MISDLFGKQKLNTDSFTSFQNVDYLINVQVLIEQYVIPIYVITHLGTLSQNPGVNSSCSYLGSRFTQAPLVHVY